MNDLMCLVMYEVWYGVQIVKENVGQFCIYDVVGLVCEFGDWLVCLCELVIYEGYLLVLMLVGVYGMIMVFNYNICGCVVEVLVDGSQVYLVCVCENLVDLFVLEKIVD